MGKKERKTMNRKSSVDNISSRIAKRYPKNQENKIRFFNENGFTS
jgi:hypothetical protein